MAVVAINRMSEQHIERHGRKDLLAVDAWREAKPEQRELALRREQFLQPIVELIDRGVSQRKAILNVITHIEAGSYPAKYLETARSLGRRNKIPSRSTIAGWLADYQKQGRTGLMDNHTGRVRQTQGWEALACRLYNMPSKPSYSAVARKLREEHDFDVTDSAVRRYLQSLPAELGENSPARLGRKLYNNTQRHFIRRTTEHMSTGDLYQGDGHTLDVYLAHPVTGDIWRAELTVWMDIKSRYIVSWYVSNAESAIDTIRCLSRALIQHNHVPPLLYVDNGSGYASRMMDDEVVGFYTRLEIDCIFALPGNAKAKGNMERWFRTMERDCSIWFGEAFCGEGMSKDVSTKFVNDCKRGLKQPPSLAQWCTRFEAWLDKYHNRPHPEFKHTTPAELWGQLQRTAVNMEELELLRPQKLRKVQRGAVRLDNREYRHVELVHHNGKEVRVEYDLQTDETVTIRTAKGQFICDATLVKKAEYIPSSRLEEAKQKSTKAAVARLEKKADEKRRRAGLLLDHTDTLHRLEEVGETQVEIRHNLELAALIESQPEIDPIDLTVEPAEQAIDIDILNNDY